MGGMARTAGIRPSLRLRLRLGAGRAEVTTREEGHLVKVLGFDNVFVEVGDLDTAVAFYQDVLGLPVHKRFEPLQMVLFDVGTETPGLGVTAVAAPRVGGQKVWFEVPDARACAEELASRGVPALAPPALIPTGWAFEVRDPWDNVLGLTDYTALPDLGRRTVAG